MKKTTLIMLASASMLLASPAANTATAQSGITGTYIMGKTQGGSMSMKGHCKGKMNQGMKSHCNCKMNGGKKNLKMKMNSPFLIKHGLPHLTKMIMPYMNDPAFNLTAEQKKQLVQVRQRTMASVKEAKMKVMALRKEIIKSSQAGVSSNADQLKDKVAELALVKAAATMTHLQCIEETKKILTKDQLYFLLANKNKKMNHGKKMRGKKDQQMMRGNGKQKMMMPKMNKPQGMKCAPGKCGHGMSK